MGLWINKGKTERMGVTKRRERLPVTISVEGTVLKQVESFRYLGSLVWGDARCDKKISAKIGMTKFNFGNMSKVMTDSGLDIQLRMRLLRCYVWSGLLYSCENWNISSIMKKILEMTEMWLIRRMLRSDAMAGTSRKLVTTAQRRQLKDIGHVLRGYSLEKDCLLGTLEGTRDRGKQRMKFMDGVKTLVGCSGIGEVILMAENRKKNAQHCRQRQHPHGTAVR